MKKKSRCTICPKGCELNLGEFGDCQVRKNIDGKIVCTTYGYPCSLNVDPIEKKPLYHFLPGSPILSMATPGCNLHCKQCQNWEISQTGLFGKPNANQVSPESIIEITLERNCPAIAYTYTEPLVSYEYTFDCCKAATESDIKNVLVTAAFINPEPLREICKYIDAANVDLKSFSDLFYRNVCDARLKPVLKALKIMKECNVMLEITNLIIPTLNDGEDETKQLCNWIVENLGMDTPLHFSKFYPKNHLKHLPPTPEETLFRAREIAIEAGLNFVYIGNIRNGEGEGTWCPGCGKLLIERYGYRILNNLIEKGICPYCSTSIHGVWK